MHDSLLPAYLIQSAVMSSELIGCTGHEHSKLMCGAVSSRLLLGSRFKLLIIGLGSVNVIDLAEELEPEPLLLSLWVGSDGDTPIPPD